MPPLSLMIKPASSNCNLKCKYCFYHSLAKNREIKSYGMMKIDLLEKIVKKALNFADYTCTIAFQGGEPTLAGLDFYQKLIEFEKKYNKKNIKIMNSIQTNGMTIDDSWAEFLAKNNFLVGLSLDGPKSIHDLNRLDPEKNGTFKRVMETVKLFNKYGVEFNILTVVTHHLSRHPRKVYNFFRKNDFQYLQFIRCLDPLMEESGSNPYSLQANRYADFLKGLFNEWYSEIKEGKMISIRDFDNFVRMAMGQRPELCSMNGVCSCQFVIEADGGVYPCDFYVIDKWRLGNIQNQGFEELRNTDTGHEFVQVSKHIDPACKECKWFSLCRGGCRRGREHFIDGKPQLNYYCSSYKDFFEYAGYRIKELAQMFMSNSR